MAPLGEPPLPPRFVPPEPVEVPLAVGVPLAVELPLAPAELSLGVPEVALERPVALPEPELLFMPPPASFEVSLTRPLQAEDASRRAAHVVRSLAAGEMECVRCVIRPTS